MSAAMDLSLSNVESTAEVSHLFSRERVQISGENLMFNMRQVERYRTIMFIIGGVVTGTLGLTSLHGLLALVILGLLSSILLNMKMGFNVLKYTNLSNVQFFLTGIQSNLMSFILFGLSLCISIYLLRCEMCLLRGIVVESCF